VCSRPWTTARPGWRSDPIGRRQHYVRQAAGQLADPARDDHDDERAGEQVGREGEDPPGLPDAAQVAQAHGQDRDRRDDSRILGPVTGIPDSAGKAETMAAEPAAVWTATVTT
jgi:hypothetical protein